MRTTSLLIATVLGLCLTGAASAAPEKVPPGMAKYLLVLWEPGTPFPGQEASGMKVGHDRPDVAKLGGRVLSERGNRLVIYLPKGEARGLRRHLGVLYLQRIWTGEPFDDWHESYELENGTGPRVAAESDTNLEWGPKTYDYDSSGNIKAAGSDSYTYDSAGRLIEATVGGKIETYKYDAFGNMVEKAIAGSAPVVMPVDGASNRLIGPEYDAAGNLVTTGNRDLYAYDSIGMMNSLQRPLAYRRFIYDVDDERVGRIHDELLSRWTIRDFDGRVLREFKSDDSPGDESLWFWEQDYVYADGVLVGGETQEWGMTTHRFGGRRHYHLDHLGSVRMTSNDQKKAVGLHDYYPYGVEQTAAWQEPLNPGDPHIDDARFTGHERDFLGLLNTENAEYLDYMHARYYDPTKGRFLSPDPLMGEALAPQTWNRYAYVGNDPINAIDPDGLAPLIITAPDPKQAEIYKFFFWSSWQLSKQFARAAAASLRQGYDDFHHKIGTVVRAYMDPDCGTDVECTDQFLMMGGVFKGGGGAARASSAAAAAALRNPSILVKMSPATLRRFVFQLQQNGWRMEGLGKGTHKGMGMMLRETDGAGKLTGRFIQFHSGGGRHGAEMYWKVSSGEYGTIRAFIKSTGTAP